MLKNNNVSHAENGTWGERAVKIGRPPERTERGESKHPGVSIIKRMTPKGERFFARWDDPKLTRMVPVLDANGEPLLDKRTGRQRMQKHRVRVEENLENHGLHSTKARENWCKTKAKNLREDAAAVASGEKRTEQTLVAKAIEAYFDSKKSELQPATLVAYKQGTRPFEIWCAKNAVVYIQELSPPLLARYREWFVGQNAYAPAKGKGAGKGKRVEGARKKSSAQENKCLNSLRVILSQLRREGRLPLMTSDDIVDSLKFVKRERAKRRYLDTAQIKLLLEAAQRHDAQGHDAIAPFVAACLLTGMRFSELCGLTFGEVDVTAGEIHLAAKRTKTSTERTVYLDKQPSLWAWLKAQKLAADGRKAVFPHLTFAIARMARARLMDTGEDGFGAPAFTYHRLRATCGTYSVCASLYGRGSEHETAKQLGHSITVAQTHYTGRAKDCPVNAESLEDALCCAHVFSRVFASDDAKQAYLAERPVSPVSGAGHAIA